MEKLAFAIVLGLLIVWGVAFLILENNYLYCTFFLKKETKLWKDFIDHSYKFKFDYVDKYDTWHFVWKDKYGNERYKALVMSNGYCSIHSNTDCILSHFDKYHSKKMKKALMGSIIPNS